MIHNFRLIALLGRNIVSKYVFWVMFCLGGGGAREEEEEEEKDGGRDLPSNPPHSPQNTVTVKLHF